MGMRAQQAGQSNQFDDLIMDPEGASEGTPMSQTNQGYDESNDDEGASGGTTSPNGKENDNNSDELEDWSNLDSQINALDNKEDNGNEKDEKEEDDDKKSEEEKGSKEGKKDDDAEKDKSDEKPDEKEDSDSDKPSGKTIKLFQDGKRYEVPTDATVKVKVDGKWEKVAVSELRDSYSGQQAWKQRVEEANTKNEILEAKGQELARVQHTIKSTLEDVTTSLKSVMENGGNPMEAVNKIVDLLQVDAYDFNKALFDSLQDELVTLSDMDEYERRAYWLEKKNEHLTKRHESFEEKMRNSQAREERIAQVDRMREAHGVSEEDFVSAFNELSENGQEVTPEQAVRYASNLPYLKSAEELLEQYEDQMSDDELDDMMARVAQSLKTNKDITTEDMATWLAQHFEVEDIVNAANVKADKLGAGNEGRKDTQSRSQSQLDLYRNASYESFDELDQY